MNAGRLGFGGVSAMALVSLGVGIGCAGAFTVQTVTRMYSREYDCPEHNVKVREIGGGRYRVTGCGRDEIAYQCFGTTCSPQSEKVEVAVRLKEPRAEDAEKPVSLARVEKNKKGSSTVLLDMPLDAKTVFKLRGQPSSDRAVQLRLVRGVGDELANCRSSAMINGERADLPTGKFTKGQEKSWISFQLSPELLRDLAVARKFALKSCDFRWTLSEDQVAEVRHFVALYQQEEAWAAPARAGGSGGLLAPAEGWPEWKPIADSLPSAGTAPDATALFKQLSPSVFKVIVTSSEAVAQGSAVAVSKNQLLTNCHVLESAQKVRVQQGKNVWPALIRFADPASDRCVLSVTDTTLVPIRGIRRQSELQVGEPMYTLGSPNGLELSLSNGILSGIREEDGKSYVQTTAPISPGSSGGGLFDARGNLVGITTAMLVGHEHLNQSLNFAIPAEAFTKP
ncbi:MAG TPA: S1C family serine protease [Polyangiaceae bacterium]